MKNSVTIEIRYDPNDTLEAARAIREALQEVIECAPRWMADLEIRELFERALNEAC